MELLLTFSSFSDIFVIPFSPSSFLTHFFCALIIFSNVMHRFLCVYALCIYYRFLLCNYCDAYMQCIIFLTVFVFFTSVISALYLFILFLCCYSHFVLASSPQWASLWLLFWTLYQVNHTFSFHSLRYVFEVLSCSFILEHLSLYSSFFWSLFCFLHIR